MVNKYQREIEEILETMERQKGLPSARPRAAAPKTKTSQPEAARLPRRPFRLRFSAGHLFVASFCLLLAGLVISAMNRGPALVSLAVWGALILFILAYATFFIQPRGRNQEKRWRGRVVEPPASGGWQERLRRRFRR